MPIPRRQLASCLAQQCVFRLHFSDSFSRRTVWPRCETRQTTVELSNGFFWMNMKRDAILSCFWMKDKTSHLRISIPFRTSQTSRQHVQNLLQLLCLHRTICRNGLLIRTHSVPGLPSLVTLIR